jgi:CBS domain-containing protein
VGELTAKTAEDEDAQRAFTRAVLDDLEALEQMLEGDSFETGIRRIGAEQEMFLVDEQGRPAPVAEDVLTSLKNPQFTTELARFNLEYNADARVFGGRCLSLLESELERSVAAARLAAQAHDSDVLLVGILPTLLQDDLSLDNMTPRDRYKALNDTMTRLRGGQFRVNVKGFEELELTHDNVMLEACNTSFQVHFQLAPDEFAKLYNVAQAVAAPVLAASVNSPVLMGRRLWRETRVALFQQSVDDRSSTKLARGHRPRVSFGDRWVDDSVIEIFRDDVARFRMLIADGAASEGPRPASLIERGEAPELKALRLHNGTVYRWNRACYGIHEGVPHLRVENRVLPSGPTILDEVANAAFFFGLMAILVEHHGDIRSKMRFDDARSNFFSAARYGLKAQFHWLDGKRHPASELILKELLPFAREGLKVGGIDDADADRYLGVLEERVRSERTGANWMLRALQDMPDGATTQAATFTMTAAMRRNQATGEPVHTWPLPKPEEQPARGDVYRTVGQLMTNEVFTVQAADLVDLAASMMDWERVRHIPVEDDDGQLVGLLSHRDLLRLVARGAHTQAKPVSVGSIMRKEPVTVTPETSLLDALHVMKKHNVGCLPVTQGNKLVGIITERDFLTITEEMLERALQRSKERA